MLSATVLSASTVRKIADTGERRIPPGAGVHELGAVADQVPPGGSGRWEPGPEETDGRLQYHRVRRYQREEHQQRSGDVKGNMAQQDTELGATHCLRRAET